MPKRKSDSDANDRPAKRLSTNAEIKQHFREDLFDAHTRQSCESSYANAKPYKHGVIPALIQPSLLRAVRSEITANISFTPKETDIYKIHQSGDLANLDRLDDSSLELLPSLVTLRDALYSREFREYLSEVTGAGQLSGRKTDMAVNVYTPGCHLLCHDDVIGSRRVSYILYLLDPDIPWREEWGGALRLYPTREEETQSGEKVAVPEPDHSVSIPPAFGQLSFFAVQPGLSYHDVEEVYAPKADEKEEADGGGRVRMAISGWYHVPQPGEEGHSPSTSATQPSSSSLAQLQSAAHELEEPRTTWIPPNPDIASTDLSEHDLSFLLEFINPRYLVPATVTALRTAFDEDSALRLGLFLSDPFASALRSHFDTGEAEASNTNAWRVARPPHKHRYLFRPCVPATPAMHPFGHEALSLDTVDHLLDRLFPSLPFRKWLSLVTGLTLADCAALARRFRRGKDYQLATRYDDEEPQLEVCLGITPSAASAGDEEDAEPATDPEVGGYEAYIATDDAVSEPELPAHANANSSATGAGQRRSARADPAVYEAAGAEEEDDDGVLFTQPASWNVLTVVLRDKGTMRFVKYVSSKAAGDRWDVSGVWKVTEIREEEEEEESGGDGGSEGEDEEEGDDEDKEEEVEKEDENEDEDQEEEEEEESDEEDEYEYAN